MSSISCSSASPCQFGLRTRGQPKSYAAPALRASFQPSTTADYYSTLASARIGPHSISRISNSSIPSHHCSSQATHSHPQTTQNGRSKSFFSGQRNSRFGYSGRFLRPEEATRGTVEELAVAGPLPALVNNKQGSVENKTVEQPLFHPRPRPYQRTSLPSWVAAQRD
jgi:hypothetical protein